ncbi:hypothetical protein TNCV_1551601 [Trichonephila clavipes]|nr:hypothetical protein TNCV_1551601 [Trichonephila clavipes]
MIRWALKLSEFNIELEHRPGVLNVVADVLSRNPVGNMDGSQISCTALRALALNSREQFIREQREDAELGHIYHYLENQDDGSVNATVCEEKANEVGNREAARFFNVDESNIRLWRRNKTNFENCDRRKGQSSWKTSWPELRRNK